MLGVRMLKDVEVGVRDAEEETKSKQERMSTVSKK